MPRKPLSSLSAWVECRKFAPEEGSTDPGDIYCPDRVGHVAACILDELLIWGGYHERDMGAMYCEKMTLWNYSLDMDRWHKYIPKGKGPLHTSGATSAVMWPWWYIFCGHRTEGHTNHVFRLNLETCTWEPVEARSDSHKRISPRDKTVSWAHDARIYVYGGYGIDPYRYLWDSSKDTFTIEGFGDERGWLDQLVAFDMYTEQWVHVPTKGPKPLGRAAHAAVRLEDVVYVFGGRNRSRRMGDLHRLHLKTFTWSGQLDCKGEEPEGRSWHTLTCLTKTTLVLYGGYNNSEQILDDLWHLNVETLSWTLLKRHTGAPRLWHTACSNSMGDLLIFGGCTNNILDHTAKMESSDLVLTARLKPFPLERLCLHALWKQRYTSMADWSSLPADSQKWLDQRQRANCDLNRKIYKCTASAIYGPSLKQLSVIQPEDARRINQNIIEVEKAKARRRHSPV